MALLGRIALIAMTTLIVIAVAPVIDLIDRGIDTRRPPGRVEAFVARRLRHVAIPWKARRSTNPEPSNPEVLRDAMEHFADHCASCHGNDGKGQTEIGGNLYPKAPDMTRPETQRLSDGELFFIIKNGVRFTGMPAWGSDTAEDDRASWQLVRFIRRLPHLTSEDLEAMSRMNPISPGEMKERKETEQFLEGAEEKPPAPEKHIHKQ
ncbi:MAG: cytochrome C [Acidobacteria bacterium]|nr:MAG: cytochrome C [Acidobacteriota bacterium]